eukprot:GHVS01029130.1.p1 GENE.GHVS01029130.1~~GHVS01029130.1.p1  ORF type:complete len:172 (-),score=16.71 GHVS01029130.1:375-890(-)
MTSSSWACLLTRPFPFFRSFPLCSALGHSSSNLSQGLPLSLVRFASTASPSISSPLKQEGMKYSDYVPKYATRYVPYSGRLEGGARWPLSLHGPPGYSGNHNYYGTIGFFTSILANKDDWGGKYYFFNKGFRVFLKIFLSGILWFYVIDPYGMKKLKAKIRTKEEREAAAA